MTTIHLPLPQETVLALDAFIARQEFPIARIDVVRVAIKRFIETERAAGRIPDAR